jgi:hypothetical protein
MSCAANGVSTPFNKRYEFLTSSDEVYPLVFRDKDKNIILNPTDFAVKFFINNRIDVELICYREGSNAPVNCEITEDGKVICYLPKDTFVEGELLYEANTSKQWTGFPPSGIFTRQRIIRSGFVYILGRKIS